MPGARLPRVSMRVLALCVVLMLGTVVAPAAGAGSAEPDDWRLLYAGGDLRDGAGTLESEIPVGISVDFPAGRFSRDGTRLAVPYYSQGKGSVRIVEPDGTSSVLAKVPSFGPTSVTWSADGSMIAVLGQVITPDDIDSRIYLFPVSGGPATLVYSDTQLLRITLYAGISWNPVDDRLAFSATEFVRDESGQIYSAPGGSDQVWTVAAAPSATPSRFTGTPVCGDCSAVPGYTQPTWSPDGSRLAVVSGVFDPFGESESFVGYLSEGALAADELVEAAPQGQLAWSDDGQRLAYGVYDTSGDFYDETVVVDADTGSQRGVVEGVIAPFVDWLPCPTGTCQVWQRVYVAPKPFMNIRGVAKRKKVVASGEMGNVPEVTDVSVTLSKRTRPGARWRKVTTVEVQAVEGLFRRAFPRPKAVQCRVKGVYDNGSARAVDTSVFSC